MFKKTLNHLNWLETLAPFYPVELFFKRENTSFKGTKNKTNISVTEEEYKARRDHRKASFSDNHLSPGCKTCSETETLHSNTEVLHTAFKHQLQWVTTQADEQRLLPDVESLHQMLKKKKTRKRKKIQVYYVKLPICFLSLFPYRGRQITALVFEKEIGIKCGAINTKIWDLTMSD